MNCSYRRARVRTHICFYCLHNNIALYKLTYSIPHPKS